MGPNFRCGIILLLLFTAISLYPDVNQTAQCILNININSHVGRPTPLFILPNTVNFKRTEDSQGTILFNSGEQILLACPGNYNRFRLSNLNGQEVIATCISGLQFKVQEQIYDFSHLTCSEWPASKEFNTSKCLDGKTLINIGFEISTGNVILYSTCHDENELHTYYTEFQLTKDAQGLQTRIDRPEWQSGVSFRNLDPTMLYKRRTQLNTIQNILNSRFLAEKYINMENDFFLSHGHLVAKGDFVYGAQQMATFWYVNCVPQWQVFNGNNWNYLEIDSRKLAATLKLDLTVYTGAMGITTLPNENGQEVNLYLTTSKVMPVPKWYWKILYEPINERGIAFVGVNNPYNEITEKDIICTNVCEKINWLSSDFQSHRNDLDYGYMYCCAIDELQSFHHTIPRNFNVASPLTTI